MCPRCYAEIALQVGAGASVAGGALWIARQWMALQIVTLCDRVRHVFQRTS